MKSSVRGDEPAYVSGYRAKNEVFPHEPTSDQFFDEPQFEAYRALGMHIVTSIFDGQDKEHPIFDVQGTLDPGALETHFSAPGG